MARLDSAPKHESPRSIYCRHDNRLVEACPRVGCLESCPLRHECPAVEPGVRFGDDRRLASG